MRLALVLTLGGLGGGIALAVLLTVFANLDAGQSILADVSVTGMFWMSAAFCLFTVPIAWVCGPPLHWLLRRFNLLHVWIGATVGAVIGALSPFTVLLVGADAGLQTVAIIWFAVSGAAAGSLIARLLRRASPAP